MAEMKAIEEEKASNKDKLDQRRIAFTQLKREMSEIEEAEQKAKQAVEDAIKSKVLLDEICKQTKAKIRENRERFRQQDAEFSYVFSNNTDLAQQQVALQGNQLANQANKNMSPTR